MFTEHYYGFEPDENFTDPDEEVVEDQFDEDAWDDISREEW